MKELTCILCPNSCTLTIDKSSDNWQIGGNLCPRGVKFAIDEMENPKRSITTTVRTKFKDIPRFPVKTQGEIPKEYIFKLMKLLDEIIIDKLLSTGDVIIDDVFNTGINVVAASDMNLWIKEE